MDSSSTQAASINTGSLMPVVLSGSGDFAFMLERIPGSYLFIGNGNTPGTCMVHNPAYDFNDGNIVVGATFWNKLVSQYLKV
jgi:hippurate hydrolase